MSDSYCLVTGCTRGLGLSLAQELKLKGKRVAGLARDRKKLENLKEKGVLDKYYCCDLSKSSEIDTFISQLESDDILLESLIHNAGIQSDYDIKNSSSYSRLIETELQVNFLAPAKITSALFPILKKSKAKVVFVTSLLQIGPKQSAPGYCASKAALANWVGNFRVQVKSEPIQVVEVIPGLIKTTMTEKAKQEGISPQILAHDIIENLHQDRIVLRGAKLPWYLAQAFPWLVKQKILEGK